MSHRIQSLGLSILHIPDAGLRLEPGQQVTVPTLTPQLTHLVARGRVALLALPPASPSLALAAPEDGPPPLPPAVSPAPPVASATAPAPSRHPGHRNAATVLPPRLLARVQRVVTGYLTIPPLVTIAETRRQQVAALQQQNASPPAMAAAVGISRRQVSRVLRVLATLEPPSPSAPPLPASLLAQVQQYVTGRLYVPAVTAATRRRVRLDQAFTAGEATAAIARRERCSARQVRRERARWHDTLAHTDDDRVGAKDSAALAPD